MLMDQAAAVSYSPCIVEEEQSMEGDQRSLTSITMVANLVDVYLADVAPDVNLKFPKFQGACCCCPLIMSGHLLMAFTMRSMYI